MKNQIYKIDATGKVLGRTASEIAKILMGKNNADYTPNLIPKNKVILDNASKTKMTEKRKLNTPHETYSGYPGGLKISTNEKIIEKKGYKELYRLAVYNMLPNNKLRSIMMKNLTINE